jgi:hypothetical protein
MEAFDDQCTGANPRYPLIDELRSILLDSYYGRPFSEFAGRDQSRREKIQRPAPSNSKETGLSVGARSKPLFAGIRPEPTTLTDGKAANIVPETFPKSALLLPYNDDKQNRMNWLPQAGEQIEISMPCCG